MRYVISKWPWHCNSRGFETFPNEKEKRWQDPERQLKISFEYWLTNSRLFLLMERNPVFHFLFLKATRRKSPDNFNGYQDKRVDVSKWQSFSLLIIINKYIYYIKKFWKKNSFCFFSLERIVTTL